MSTSDTAPPISVTRFRVRYAETDAMGVVHHSRYLPWLEMGRTEYIRQRGYTYRELEQQGVMMAVIEVQMRYKAPAVYDDPIRLETRLVEFGRVKLRFAYQVYHDETGRLLAEGETLHAFIGRNGAPLRVATQFPAIWERLQAAVAAEKE
jgi:acyl-CoA thioester hydrolase